MIIVRCAPERHESANGNAYDIRIGVTKGNQVFDLTWQRTGGERGERGTTVEDQGGEYPADHRAEVRLFYYLAPQNSSSIYPPCSLFFSQLCT